MRRVSSRPAQQRWFGRWGRLASVTAASALAFAGLAAPSLAATTPPDVSAN
jgi:hypothetical protein